MSPAKLVCPHCKGDLTKYLMDTWETILKLDTEIRTLTEVVNSLNLPSPADAPEA